MNDDVEFDRAKDAANRLKHGLGLSALPQFTDPPSIRVDDRYDYGEVRYLAIGRVNGKGYSAVITIREGIVRLISLRRAREKELRRYGQ